MGYLAKETLVKALETIKDTNIEVPAPCVSAVQYFIALDRFYRVRSNEEIYLNTNSKEEKKEFISYVSDVISLDDNNYFKTLKDIYNGPKTVSQTINSNFFGGSSVDISKKSSDKTVYPQQGEKPLLYALEGRVYRNEEYYTNLKYYLTTSEARLSMALWLLRKVDKFTSFSIEELRSFLGEVYTKNMVDTLLDFSDEEWNETQKSFRIEGSENMATITIKDIINKMGDESEKRAQSRQLIFYGAPGTGKSHTIKREVDEKQKTNFRVTFHPDSDYSTFVGCYKPTMKENVITKNGVESKEEQIVYRFVPQAFTKAYIAAWNTNDEVYLIIEEINRGNCAQIFGDLFQLLDRKNNVSEYPVDADSDLADYLHNKLKESTRTDFPDGVKEGKKLVLPSNLYIWATMNTSDQSLFPIDSAFKRRWEWKYIKIKKGKDEDGNELNWMIDVKLKDANGQENNVSWWNFINQINKIIASMTSSSDKQLGYFFCKAKDGIIDKQTFVSKVIFYLWNDVFKDYGFEDNSLFRYTDNEEEQDLTFPDFFKDEIDEINDVRLTDFVQKVMNWKKTDDNKD